MKPHHLEKLKEEKADLKKILLELLTQKEDEMTFNEFMELCSDKPPITIEPAVLFDIGLNYNKGRNGFEKDPKKAYSIFEYMRKKNLPCGYFACGMYLYNGTLGEKNLEAALENFLHCSNVEKDKNLFIRQVNLHIARIYFSQEKYSDSIKYFKEYYTCEEILKENKDKILPELLQASLLSLYEIVDDTPQAPKIKKIISKNPYPGWTTKINNTFIDACDMKETKELVEITQEYNLLCQKKNNFILDLEEAKEEGYPDENIEEIEKTISSLKKEISKLKDELLNIKHAARRKEKSREYYVQKRFFDPIRTHASETKNIAEHLQKLRLEAEYKESLKLKSVPARRIITAERSTIEASKKCLGLGNSFEGRNQLGWINQKPEEVKFGELPISYHQNPGTYPNHLGNFFITIPFTKKGDYNEILAVLLKLANSTKDEPNKNNEKTLASFMLRYAKEGKLVSLQELEDLNDNTTQEMANAFNTICYHVFVKEIARRMPCKEDKYDFPSAILTAREVKLIANGDLSLKDVFASDAPYGVVTGQFLCNNHERVEIKINRINALYNKVFYGPENKAELASFFKEHENAIPIASRQQLRKELQETYGGDSDTDGEGYSSSEEENLFTQKN